MASDEEMDDVDEVVAPPPKKKTPTKDSKQSKLTSSAKDSAPSSSSSSSSSTKQGASPDTLPWVEKYRPKDFSELIAHDDIINTRMQFVFILLSFMNEFTIYILDLLKKK